MLTRRFECEYGKFVAAQAGNDVGVAEGLFQGVRRAKKCAVSLGVSKGIVDLLQVIYVGKEKQ